MHYKGCIYFQLAISNLLCDLAGYNFYSHGNLGPLGFLFKNVDCSTDSLHPRLGISPEQLKTCVPLMKLKVEPAGCLS